jgi:polysaccharide export outer membrane protein
VIGPPDQLTVTILPEPIIERSVLVRPDGMISIDLIGDVPAAGRTPEEIAADIENRISRFKRNARVTVALEESLSAQVTVLGEVIRPVTFPLERETRVVEALGMVGGPTIFAAKSRIKVIRFQEGKSRIYRVNLNALEDGDLGTNILLQGGDLIVVLPPCPPSSGTGSGTSSTRSSASSGSGPNPPPPSTPAACSEPTSPRSFTVPWGYPTGNRNSRVIFVTWVLPTPADLSR